jgi:hypothetical protein
MENESSFASADTAKISRLSAKYVNWNCYFPVRGYQCRPAINAFFFDEGWKESSRDHLIDFHFAILKLPAMAWMQLF